MNGSCWRRNSAGFSARRSSAAIGRELSTATRKPVTAAPCDDTAARTDSRSVSTSGAGPRTAGSTSSAGSAATRDSPPGPLYAPSSGRPSARERSSNAPARIAASHCASVSCWSNGVTVNITDPVATGFHSSSGRSTASRSMPVLPMRESRARNTARWAWEPPSTSVSAARTGRSSDGNASDRSPWVRAAPHADAVATVATSAPRKQSRMSLEDREGAGLHPARAGDKTRMPRALWTGSISFGLVNVPVRLYSAVQEHDLHFNFVHEPDGSRIGYEKICKAEEKTVPDDEIVKAFEYEKGEWVYMAEEDFEAAAAENHRTIDIRTFVPFEEIDPIYFERTYYLGPQEDGERVYALLARAMADSGLAGVAKWVMRDRQNLGLLRVREGVITLE